MKTLLATIFFSVLILFLPQLNQQYNGDGTGAAERSGQYGPEGRSRLAIEESEGDNLFTGDITRLTCPGKPQNGMLSKKCAPANWIIPSTAPANHVSSLRTGSPLLCMLAPANKLEAMGSRQPSGELRGNPLPGEELPELYEIDDVRIVSGLIRIDLSN